MGQIPHGCARTTAAVRRAIQHSQESLKALSERYDINPKTVLKWRKRSSVEDAPIGPKTPRSTTLTVEEEAIREALQRGEPCWCHAFEHACAINDIDHRLTKPNHPWTNGQVERMNRTIKEATVRLYHYDSHDQLREHLETFINAYNFAKRLKTLRNCSRSFEEEDKESEVNELEGGIEPAFRVFPELPTFFEPREGAFDDPAFWNDGKGAQFIAFGHLD